MESVQHLVQSSIASKYQFCHDHNFVSSSLLMISSLGPCLLILFVVGWLVGVYTWRSWCCGCGGMDGCGVVGGGDTSSSSSLFVIHLAVVRDAYTHLPLDLEGKRGGFFGRMDKSCTTYVTEQHLGCTTEGVVVLHVWISLPIRTVVVCSATNLNFRHCHSMECVIWAE